MFANYFKTAFRNLWKRKGFSFLNIIGLSIGIACAALIFLWVEDELTYNDYFKNKSTLYQVMTNQTYDGETFTFSSTPGLLAPSMKTEIPGIKLTTRATWGERIVFTTGDKSLYTDGMQVDSSFAKMFNLELISGSVDKPFPQIQSILINERLALKLFNSLDVVGKSIKYDNKEEYIVSGVYKNLPNNARFQSIEWLISFENFLKKNDWLQYWGNNGVQTYAQLNPETDPVQVNAKLKNFIKSKQEDAVAQPLLLAASDWRLRSEFKEGRQSGGRIKLPGSFYFLPVSIL
jgi:putative ABC transport system permease protein